jgi:hypothetical protein
LIDACLHLDLWRSLSFVSSGAALFPVSVSISVDKRPVSVHQIHLVTEQVTKQHQIRSGDHFCLELGGKLPPYLKAHLPSPHFANRRRQISHFDSPRPSPPANPAIKTMASPVDGPPKRPSTSPIDPSLQPDIKKVLVAISIIEGIVDATARESLLAESTNNMLPSDTPPIEIKT